MGFFSIFCKGKRQSDLMPMDEALDMLENVCKRFPQLVLEWITANPQLARSVKGCVSQDVVAPYRKAGWDGPYSITTKSPLLGERVTNIFFQDLRRDVVALTHSVTQRGERENSAIKWLLAMKAPREFSDIELAEEIRKRGVRHTRESALEFVQDTYKAAQNGLFDDILSRGEKQGDDKFIALLENNALALRKMAEWQEMSRNFVRSDEDQNSIVAACLMAFVTTMLNTVDYYNVIEDKEVFYSKTRDIFPSLRPKFNACLNFYEQIPHSLLAQLTTDVEQDQKLMSALLFGFTTWCLMELEGVGDPDELKSTPNVLQVACIGTYQACKELYGVDR